MDPPSTTPDLGQDDENLRVKFLCSFSGSVMPRPQDGKLRYVGGETRMVSLCRCINYEELMEKMKEIYEGTSLLKYQQPDEDLDAVVSIVNDDDVMNMMEENDKLSHSVDGFTRLRIFLFSIPDVDSPSRLEIEGNESGISRYVDALNNLPDSSDHLLEIQGSHDLLLQQHQFNLRHLAVPRLDQRYTDAEGGVRSPAYCSPTHHHDLLSEFPSSPSSAIFQTKISDDYSHQQTTPPPPHRFPDNLVWIPHGERACFPINLNNHGCNPIEGGIMSCENCRMNLQRNRVFPEEHLYFQHQQQQQHHPCFKNVGYQAGSSDNSPSNREIPSINLEQKVIHDAYMKGIGGPFNNEGHSSDKGWRGNYHVANPQSRTSNFSNYDHHHHHYHHDVLHDQSGRGRSFSPMSNEEENATVFGHFPHTCRVDCTNQASYHHLYPAGGGTTGPMAIRGTPENSPRFFLGKEGQNIGFDGYAIPTDYSASHPSRINPAIFNQGNHHIVTTDDRETQYFAPSMPIVSQIPVTNSSTQTPTSQQLNRPSSPRGIGENLVSSCMDSEGLDSDACVCDDKNSVSQNEKSLNNGTRSNIPHLKEGREDMVSRVSNPESTSCSVRKHVDEHLISPVEDLADGSLHEISESVKEMSLRDCKEPKTDVHNVVLSPSDVAREDVLVGVETVSVRGDKDIESGNEQSDMSRIEPTKAEEEALSRGLQTIKNDDLEEIRELGSGTYGAVYHGKWRGSDVAVKRIKATCFSGKPSERERLITDFWKEALILSSLHHPNVVSFYGIVRDGPDGSLATVTEFMINGSLKQFLHKKDRTVDRRKRLIIGMDVAFGMEYLHGKNIVHFDLKCENLLVNMRDPQRPICKIGDLGLSKVKRNTLVSGGVRGTLPWMAPELLCGKNGMVTEKIDVYSFGIVMWELLTGEDPYSEMHCASIIGGIVNNELRPEIPPWCDPEWKCLMESCWASEPAQRPSFSHISQKLRTMGAAINLK